MELITWVIPVAGIVSILFALYLAWGVLHADTGTEAMVVAASDSNNRSANTLRIKG